jgi:hypothetical protein
MGLAADINELLAVEGVLSLAPGGVSPVLAPQGCARPYVVWRRQSGDPLATLNTGAGGGRRTIVLLIGAYAETFDEADALADAIRTAVLAGSTTMRGKSIRPPIDGFEPETRLFSVVLEAILFHRS